MQSTFARPLVAAGILAMSLLGLTLSATAQDGARYTVTFKSAWTAKSHPFEFPESGVFTGPHFSGLIGATHNGGYRIFQEGAMPTPGLERLSEEGKHSPLDKEIKDAMKAGKVGMLFETGPVKDVEKGMESTEVMVTAHYPMVSAAAMIAPSPDWFTGVENVSLMENGKWVQTKTVDLYAWDSGGDDGTTYKADDKDANPKKATMMAVTPHFRIEGKAKPVATLTFTMVK